MYPTVTDIWERLIAARRELAEVKERAERLIDVMGEDIVADRIWLRTIHTMAATARWNIGGALKIARENKLAPLTYALYTLLREVEEVEENIKAVLDNYHLIKTQRETLVERLRLTAHQADIITKTIYFTLNALEHVMATMKEIWEKLMKELEEKLPEKK